MTINTQDNKKGFTIFFAILIIALLLAVATSISFLASKQLQLLTLGSQSELAFYAADSGAECALYWDKSSNPTPFDPAATADSKTNIVCDQNSITASSATQAYPAAVIWSFNTTFNSGALCAVVTVTKTNDNGVVLTDVNSRGYDGPCGGSEVERAIHYGY